MANSANARNEPTTGVVSDASTPRPRPPVKATAPAPPGTAFGREVRRRPEGKRRRAKNSTLPKANASPVRVGSWPIAISMTVATAKYQLPAGRSPSAAVTSRSKQVAAAAADRAASGHSPR